MASRHHHASAGTRRTGKDTITTLTQNSAAQPLPGGIGIRSPMSNAMGMSSSR